MVLWSKREYNTVADHAVNAWMDCRESWTQVCDAELESITPGTANVRVCVDGGIRKHNLGALGIAIYASSVLDGAARSYELVARQGILLDQVDSAFLSEALALDAAL